MEDTVKIYNKDVLTDEREDSGHSGAICREDNVEEVPKVGGRTMDVTNIAEQRCLVMPTRPGMFIAKC